MHEFAEQNHGVGLLQFIEAKTNQLQYLTSQLE